MGRGLTQSERDAAFRQRLDDAKARRNLSDVLERHTVLKRRGREMVGLCPFHQEKSPSFEVNDAKGVFYCHGCGSHGDHFTVLTRLDGLTFREAYEALTNETFPTVAPEARARALEEDERARASAIADARGMWRACGPIAGTPAERYLRNCRKITIASDALRYGRVPTSRDEEGRWKQPFPALVLPVTHEIHGLVGVQRIFLLNDGSDKRWGKKSKLSLGRPLGGAVRLSDGGPENEVIICEGPEDGLSLAQQLDRRVWVALGTAMMPMIVYPGAIDTVIVAGQNDAPGRAAVAKAENGLLEKGLATRLMWPADGYADWNDQLRGIRC